MLLQLTVDRFALIEHIRLTFSDHFNVLVGETGAGKSIIVDAVKLLLGGRASAHDVRYGAEDARIEGVFSLDDAQSMIALLQELDIPVEEELILVRSLRANGRNVCRINQQAVTLAQYRRVGQALISIHGQQDFQQLADAKAQLRMLDAYGGAPLLEQRETVAAAYRNAQKSGKAYKRAQLDGKKREQEMARIARSLQILDDAKLRPGEEDTLRMSQQQLANAGAMKDVASQVYSLLYGSEQSAYNQLARAEALLRGIAHLDAETLRGKEQAVSEAVIILQELAFDMRAYSDTLDADDIALAEVDDRIRFLDQLKKQFGQPIDALIAQAEEWRTLEQAVTNQDHQLKLLQQAYQEDRKHFEAAAGDLSRLRQATAKRFEAALLAELRDLAMEKARFEITFMPCTGHAAGIDDIQFVFSTNPGMPLLAVHEIASGGEMSRLMLALQTVTRDVLGTETLIFDEIDTGIGGMTLGNIADKLAMLGQSSQVICVTHAAAIAARADAVFVVSKAVDKDDTTKTSVAALPDEEAIVTEIARMLGGYDSWQYEHARRLRYPQPM